MTKIKTALTIAGCTAAAMLLLHPVAKAETDADGVFRVYLWDKDGGKASFPADLAKGLARYLSEEVIPKFLQVN